MSTLRAMASLCAAALSLLACGEGPAGRGEEREVRMALDLRALLGEAGGARRPLPGSVIDTLQLDVVPEGGAAPQRFGRKLGRGDTLVTFSVTVPPGRTSFRARVLGGRGTELLSGETTVDVRRDGFDADLALQPRAPILVLRPDSFAVRLGTLDSTLVISNVGLDTLAWRIDHLSCERCPTLFPTSGRLLARRSARLQIRPGSLPPQTITMLIDSPEGSVDVRFVLVQ